MTKKDPPMGTPKLLFGLGALIALISLGSCVGSSDAERSLEQARRNARPIYLEQCSPCHGEAADGNGPNRAMLEPKPRDYTDPSWLETASPETVYDAIDQGVRGTAMPAWGPYLSEQEIRDLTTYVLSVATLGPRIGSEKPAQP